MTLPAIALGMTSMALVARVTRSSVRDELGREHVQTAVSRGIPFPLVLRRHVLRNAAIPITTIAGLTIGVHKSCAWFVDNHVDEQPIPCRTTAPHTLPNQ